MRRLPRSRRASPCVLALLLVLALAAPARAAFPGSSGRILVGVYSGTTPTVARAVYSFDGNGAPLGKLGLQTGRFQTVAVSADGTQIVGRYYRSGLAQPVLADDGVYIGPLDGGDPARLPVRADDRPTFLPDGRVLLLRYNSSNGVRELWTVAADGTGLARIASIALASLVDDVVVAPDGSAVFYVEPGNSFTGVPDRLWRHDLATNQRTLLHSRPLVSFPIQVSDVSPDGQTVLFQEQADNTVGGGGSPLPPFLLRSVGARGGTPRTLSPGRGYPHFSPDGRQIVYYQGLGEIRAMAPDGTGDHRLLQLRLQPEDVVTSVNWAPGPSLDVSVSGGVLVGDAVELDLTVGNFKETPFTGVAYASGGGATGLVLNTALYSPSFRAGYSLLGGPAPAPLASRLEARQRREHQYLLGIDRPGNVQVRAEVSATNTTTGPIEVEDTTYIVARNRDFSDGEEAILVAGGYAEVQDQMQRQIERTVGETTDAVSRALQRTLPKARRAAARKTTAVEAALAERSGLPDDALSWLPKNEKDAAKAYFGFVAAADEATDRVYERVLGDLYTRAVRIPIDYWTGSVPGDPQAAIPVGTALYDEGAYWAGRAQAGAESYAIRAYTLATNRTEHDKFNQAVEQTVTDFGRKLRALDEIAPQKARQIAKLMRDDPERGGRMLGDVYGTLRGEIGWMAAQTLITENAAGAVKGMTTIGNRLRRFERITDEADDATRTLRGLHQAATADRAVDAARLGMPKGDQTRWAEIVQKLEATAKKYGHEIDLRLSFRPRNPYSAKIADGAGKNMFMKGKTGTELDLLLGMDESGLGKFVIYDAKRPPNYRDLPASMRAEIDQRITDMHAARAEWLDRTSNLGKARRANGVELRASVGDGNVTTTIKMKLEGQTINGTTSVRYRQLVVDGKTIVKPGNPKWVVSDYDGNAFLQVNGRNLPAGIKGILELEAMRLQREAGTTMATSFHGFTHNGFDLPAAAYRKNFHFLLEGMNDKQAKQALDLYLKKYATRSGDYIELINSYTNGDYVIQVTRDGATAAQGL